MLLTATSSTTAKTKLFSAVSLSSSSSSSSSDKEAEEEEVKDVAVEVAVASAATEVLKKPFRPFTNRLFRATSSPPPPLLSSSSFSSSSSTEPQQALETTEDKEEETEECEPNNSTTNYHERRERADSWTPSFAPLPLSLASASSASRWTLLPSSSAHPQKLSAQPQQQTQRPTTRTKEERKREREQELRELCSQMDYTDLLEAVRFHRWQVVEEVLRQGGKKLGRDPTLWQNVFRAYDGEKRSYFEEEGEGEESDEGESDGEEQQQAEKVFSFEKFEEQLRKEKRRERRYWKKVIKVLIGWRHPNVIYGYGIMLLDPVLLELLLENGLDPRKRYEKHMGWTLLHPLSLLSQNNRFTEVELRFMLLLLEHGLNINACDHQGKTLFLLLAESIDSPSQLPKLETALKLGSFINARDFNGNTALHLLDDRQVFLAEWLIKHGANRNILNNDGRSPERQALHSQNMRLATWFHSTSHSSLQQNGSEGKKNSKKNKKAEKSIKRKGSAEDYITRRQREEEELEEEKKRMRKEKGEEGEEEEMEQERQRRQQMTYQRQAQLKMANSALKYGFTPEWVIDEDFEECWNCRSAFKFVTRRHHCRLCGYVFCHSCTSNQVLVKGIAGLSSSPSRVCDTCFALLTFWKKDKKSEAKKAEEAEEEKPARRNRTRRKRSLSEVEKELSSFLVEERERRKEEEERHTRERREWRELFGCEAVEEVPFREKPLEKYGFFANFASQEADEEEGEEDDEEEADEEKEHEERRSHEERI